ERRLIYDAELSAKPCRHTPSREFLQRDQPIGAGERAHNRRPITIDVAVDVGAAQAHNQWAIRMPFAKSTNAVRAAPGVQGNHEIGGGSVVAISNVNARGKLAQGPRPAHAGGPVSRP